MENHHTTVGMSNLFDFHPKSDRLEELFRHRYRIIERLRSNYPTRGFVRNPEKENSPAFVRDGHAVLIQLHIVKLDLGFLELQSLVLRG